LAHSGFVKNIAAENLRNTDRIANKHLPFLKREIKIHTLFNFILNEVKKQGVKLYNFRQCKIPSLYNGNKVWQNCEN
jgi:hypothetical protein